MAQPWDTSGLGRSHRRLCRRRQGRRCGPLRAPLYVVL